MGKGIKVKNTTISGGLTGHDEILGKVFSHRSGANHSIMKKFVQPANPKTAKQEVVRSAFAQSSAGWSNLTEAERQNWNNEAPNVVNTGVFGNRNQSGKNLYTATNVALAVAGLPAITSPGQRTLPIAMSNVVWTVVIGAMEITVDAEEMFYLGKIVVKATKPQSAGTSKFPKPTILKTVAYATSQAIDFTNEFEARFGTPIAGQKVSIEVGCIGSGGFYFPFTSTVITV